MKLQLIARHLRDDQDMVIAEADDVTVQTLVMRMQQEIDDNRVEGSDWRFSIVPLEAEYAVQKGEGR